MDLGGVVGLTEGDLGLAGEGGKGPVHLAHLGMTGAEGDPYEDNRHLLGPRRPNGTAQAVQQGSVGGEALDDAALDVHDEKGTGR